MARGEFLSAKLAWPVYALFGKKGLDDVKDLPEINSPVMRDVGYHRRQGRHDLTLYDWQRYIEFADKHLKKKEG